MGETESRWICSEDGAGEKAGDESPAGGCQAAHKPALLVTEYGGIALEKSVSQENWGYGDAEKDEEAVIRRYEDVTKAIMGIPGCSGFCYTQLTDVYQEVNGLLDGNHQPKVSPERIREINQTK